MSNTIKLIAGATLSYSGVVAMPTGTWTGTAIAVNQRTGAVTNIAVDLTLVGPTTGDPNRNDWAITMRATGAQTGALASGGQTVLYSVVLKFTDNSATPVVLYSNPFLLQVRSWPS